MSLKENIEGQVIGNFITSLSKIMYTKCKKLIINKKDKPRLKKNIIKKINSNQNNLNTKKVHILVQRFRKFKELNKSSLSEFLDLIPDIYGIDLVTYDNDYELLDKLRDRKLIKWISKNFNVNEKWFIGESDYLYEEGSSDCKLEETFLRYLSKLNKSSNIKIIFLKTDELNKDINYNSETKQQVFLIIKETKLINEKEITTFQIPHSNYFYWNEYEMRLLAKRLIFYFDNVFPITSVYGYDITSENEYTQFLKGTISFSQMIRNAGITWYPYDYIPCGGNVNAKETDEYFFIEKESKYKLDTIKGEIMQEV